MNSDQATLQLHRTPRRKWYGFQSLKVELDGQLMGQLKGGETKTFQLAPGSHRLRLKFRVWVWSDPLSFMVAPNEVFSVECGNDRWGYPWVEQRAAH